MSKIKDFPLEERPREKLIKYGLTSLSNSELLALILEKGTKEKNVIELSQELLSKYTLKELSIVSAKNLMSNNGIGLAKACQIVASFELSRRLESYKEEFNPTIKCPDDVFKLLHPKTKTMKKEHLFALFLDTKKRLIKEELIFVGTLDCSIIHPREIIYSAIRECASSIIIAHNHPSGDPTPSKEDIRITEQIKKSCEIVGIPLLDHIIIGEKRYVSIIEMN